MGVILDSSVLITTEREGKTVRDLIERVLSTRGEVEIGVSVITVAELIHGAYRAADPETA
jgi:predicted nucleic acid-binding protein